MTRPLLLLAFILALSCRRAENNVASFCRDFNAGGCTEVLQTNALYTLQKSRQNGTMRDFWNSVYFRGDRLAFEIRNADARRAVDFDCLRGYYFTGSDATQRHELEYIELRDKNVYGLVMVGSLLEKKFTAEKSSPYHAPQPFTVTYAVFCSNDLLARASIQVEMR